MSPKISTNASLQLRILYGLPLAISLFAIVYSFSSGKLLVAVLAIVVAVAIIFAEIFFERRLSQWMKPSARQTPSRECLLDQG